MTVSSRSRASPASLETICVSPSFWAIARTFLSISVFAEAVVFSMVSTSAWRALMLAEFAASSCSSPARLRFPSATICFRLSGLALPASLIQNSMQPSPCARAPCFVTYVASDGMGRGTASMASMTSTLPIRACIKGAICSEQLTWFSNSGPLPFGMVLDTSTATIRAGPGLCASRQRRMSSAVAESVTSMASSQFLNAASTAASYPCSTSR